MKRIILATAIALAATLGATGCAVTSGQQSVGSYVDDATVTARVKTRFAEDPSVAAMRINVETLKGEVQLSGFAATETEKANAASIARAVPDVKSVRNNIVVRPKTN